MNKDKTVSIRVILIFVIMFSLGTVLGLTAYMLSLKKAPEVIIQPDKPINPNPSDASETDISDWKTYRNGEYWFQIRYPENWEYRESDNTIYFGTPESKSGGYIWGISIYDPDELEKTISQTGNQFDDRKEIREKIMINKNISGTLVTITTRKHTDWISKSIYFEENGKLFAIRNGSIIDDRFEAFYNSFEFVEKDETADWKTYQNKDYGISFKYPSSWLLKEDISVDKNTFSMWFSIEKPNTILTVVGISDEYVNEGPPGRYGYCASYKNVDQFCNEGCIKLNNSTATSRGIINRGDIGYSLLAYTDVSRNFSSICWDLDLSSLLSEISKKKNVSFYKVTNEDVETYLQEGSASEEMENVIKNFELLSRSIELF